MNVRTTLAASALMMAAYLLAAAAPAIAAGDNAMTQTADGYTMNLNVLPAEPFVDEANAKKTANAGAMVNGGGADPVAKNGSEHPNHHLVVFIKKDGKPVEDADVSMNYKKQSSDGETVDVPVSRMWVAGKGKKTTHYGNNVMLEPGKYVVHVTVNGNAKGRFTPTVK